MENMIIDIYMCYKASDEFLYYEKRLLEVPGCTYPVYRPMFNGYEFYFHTQNILVRILYLLPVAWFDGSANCPDYYYTNNSVAAATLQFILEGRSCVCLESFNDILKILNGQKE